MVLSYQILGGPGSDPSTPNPCTPGVSRVTCLAPRHSSTVGMDQVLVPHPDKRRRRSFTFVVIVYSSAVRAQCWSRYSRRPRAVAPKPQPHRSPARSRRSPLPPDAATTPHATRAHTPDMITLIRLAPAATRATPASPNFRQSQISWPPPGSSHDRQRADPRDP